MLVDLVYLYYLNHACFFLFKAHVYLIVVIINVYTTFLCWNKSIYLITEKVDYMI